MTKTKKIAVSIISIMIAALMLFSIYSSVISKAQAASVSSEMKISAKSALLMDYHTGKIVFRQNEKIHLPIASMVKIMTLLLVYEEISGGQITEDTLITASENATSMGGSQAFLDTNAQYKLGELIKSIVVGSANDSCVAIAEHISGDVTSFVDVMNKKAAGLNMENTNFVNCTGLPAPNQYSCAEDVATMTRALINHPLFFKYSTIWMFNFEHPGGRVTELSNTNKLIRYYEGCDGGKTGFTNEAMYCLSATAKRGNTRLISVVMGAETSKIRNAENSKLFNHGFANYETRQIVFKDLSLDKDFEVQNGKEKTVKLAPCKDFYHFMPKNNKPDIKIEETVDKIAAPIAAGQKLGTIKITVNGEEIGSVDLVSKADIGKMTYLDIIDDLIEQW